MNRQDILTAIKQYFNIKELVCNHTYARWGEQAWQFLDTAYLWCLLIIRRDILQAPMTCNTKTNYQRGLRCNMCAIVKGKTAVYLSSHILGKAGDFTISGMTAEETRNRIKANANRLPCAIRLEAGVSWLHFDVLPQAGVTKKVYEFKV